MLSPLGMLTTNPLGVGCILVQGLDIIRKCPVVPVSAIAVWLFGIGGVRLVAGAVYEFDSVFNILDWLVAPKSHSGLPVIQVDSADMVL